MYLYLILKSFGLFLFLFFLYRFIESILNTLYTRDQIDVLNMIDISAYILTCDVTRYINQIKHFRIMSDTRINLLHIAAHFMD